MTKVAPEINDNDIVIAIIIDDKKKNKEWAPEFLYIEDNFINYPFHSEDEKEENNSIIEIQL